MLHPACASSMEPKPHRFWSDMACYSEKAQSDITSVDMLKPGPRLNIKNVFPGMGFQR